MTRRTHMLCASVVTFAVFAACLSVLLLTGCSESRRYDAGSKPRVHGPVTNFDKQRDPPPTANTLFSLAGILAAQGKQQQCEFVLKQCIQEHPEFVPAYNSLAELMMRQGRAGDAAAVLIGALEIAPRDPVLLNNLGMCLMVHKEYEKSLECFTKAAGLVPQCKKYRANMATALGLLGRHDESLSLMQQVLADQDAVHNVQVLREASEKVSELSGKTPS